MAQNFVDMHPTGARWTIDHYVIQEPEAVVEWTMLVTPSGETNEVLDRGIDWFLFQEDGRIKEIREFVQRTRLLEAAELS